LGREREEGIREREEETKLLSYNFISSNLSIGVQNMLK
jgi:hypothetical protein